MWRTSDFFQGKMHSFFSEIKYSKKFFWAGCVISRNSADWSTNCFAWWSLCQGSLAKPRWLIVFSQDLNWRRASEKTFSSDFSEKLGSAFSNSSEFVSWRKVLIKENGHFQFPADQVGRQSGFDAIHRMIRMIKIESHLDPLASIIGSMVVVHWLARVFISERSWVLIPAASEWDPVIILIVLPHYQTTEGSVGSKMSDGCDAWDIAQ